MVVVIVDAIFQWVWLAVGVVYDGCGLWLVLLSVGVASGGCGSWLL